MKDGKDQRAILGSFLVEDDMFLATGNAQILPVSENRLSPGFAIPDRFKVCVEETDIVDRLIGIPSFDGLDRLPNVRAQKMDFKLGGNFAAVRKEIGSSG